MSLSKGSYLSRAAEMGERIFPDTGITYQELENLLEGKSGLYMVDMEDGSRLHSGGSGDEIIEELEKEGFDGSAVKRRVGLKGMKYVLENGGQRAEIWSLTEDRKDEGSLSDYWLRIVKSAGDPIYSDD